MNRLAILAVALVAVVGLFVWSQPSAEAAKGKGNQEWPAHLASDRDTTDWKAKDQAYWKAALSGQEFDVCRDAGTERPWSSAHNKTKEAGVFHCSSCGQALFSMDDKFESGTGWPSFTQPVSADAVKTHTDASLGMVRTEAVCGRCDAHLGHVFKDGPQPTGERWCINGVCLLHRAD
ncbi:MAG: peptide-methionine (R)-S-oxide reductase MsrB [Proteobacteria bacterium]|nr:peptide-methionine (R)-S-oxide reductase MsrB [Pseudomonadota bacterium]